MSLPLGKKIQYFRKRAKLTQLQLENLAQMSNGSVSRIESSIVNPTKETVFKIAEFLSLNGREIDWLIGLTAEEASPQEIEKAKEEVKRFLELPQTLAYLLCDRRKFWAVSKSFQKLLGVPNKNIQKLFGRSILELLYFDELGLRQKIDPAAFKEILEEQLIIQLSEAGHLKEEDWFKTILRIIKEDPEYGTILKNIEKNLQLYPFDKIISFKAVPFKIGYETIRLEYEMFPLIHSPRFMIVHYSLNPELSQLQKTP